MQVLAPVAAVERDAARVERGVSRAERLFHRHRRDVEAASNPDAPHPGQS